MRRTGGFTGAEVRSQLDTDALSPAEAAELAALVGTLDLDRLGAVTPPPVPMPDAMRYELEIERGEERRTVTLSEPAVPAEVRPLLQRLVAAARA